jgi:hypothetical protein
MKKLYLLLVIINNISSVILIGTYLHSLIINSFNIILMIIIGILYLLSTITIIKHKRNITSFDLICISIYMLFIMSFFVFSMIYQVNNTYTYNMLYFIRFAVVPNILFNLFNLVK